MVEPHSTAGRVKIGRSALEKRSIYRGVVANHLIRQVTGFRAFDKDAYAARTTSTMRRFTRR